MVLAIILLLAEHSSQTTQGGISLEEERFLEVSKSEYQCCHTFHLQDVKGF